MDGFDISPCSLLMALLVIPCRAVSELRIDVRPSQGVMQGVNVSLQCLNRTNAAPVKVTKWEFMGHLLEQPSPRIRISHPQTKHQLDIMSVEVSDTGRYSCTSESNGNKYNASLYITVYSGRPRITYATPTIRAKIGSYVTLKCDGQNQDYIIWSKDGDFIRTGQDSRFQLTRNRSLLHIVNLMHADNGSYECKFISTEGIAARNIELIVLNVVTNSYNHTSHHNTSALVKIEADGRNNTEATVQTTNAITGTSTVSFTSSTVDTTEDIWDDTDPKLTTLSMSPSTCYHYFNQEVIPKWTLVIMIVCAVFGILGAVVCSVYLTKWIFQKCRNASKPKSKGYPVEVEGTTVACETGKVKDGKATGPFYEVLQLYETISEVNSHKTGEEHSFTDSFNCDSSGYVPMTNYGFKGKLTDSEDQEITSTGTAVGSDNTGTTGYVEMSLLMPGKQEGDVEEEHSHAVNKSPSYKCERSNLSTTNSN